ncbi:Alpha/Beta hydrolase protein [Roridomyces roridus]|uniref:Alpha/Beta hydrolase protein n=1 Tax=Roridomyces roridus TaxID=1738132 RepID=A0AAD7BA83_9AGAR|nr:Alpha/Beta hydrolase protein [Roridomyces roridus]
MASRASVLLTYLLLLVPPIVVSTFYLLVSFPTPPHRLPAPVFPGLSSLPPDSRARDIYPEDWLDDGYYADLPMGRTRYWLVGPESGSKVVLIHGLSVPAFVWEPLIPQLTAAGNRVLVYDLYGRGYSDAPAAGVVYDPHLYVTQLALLLQHVGWQRTRLVGYSMGGAITAAFVATFPRLVEDDIVLIASAGLVESSDLPRTAKVMSSPIVQLLTANPIIKAYLRRLATSRSSPSSESAGVNTLAELVRLQSAHLPGFNRAVSSSLRSGPVRGMSWAFESEGWRGRRVLVVHGTQDNTVPSAHAARIRGLIVEAGASTNSTSSLPSSPPPSASSPTRKWSWFASASDSSSSLEREPSARVEVEMIPGAGHALTWTHADEVGALVCRFLGGDGV